MAEAEDRRIEGPSPGRSTAGRARGVCAVLAVVTVAIVGLPGASAQDVPPFRPAVEAAIEGAIRPGYAALLEAAGEAENAIRTLCAAPSEATLETTRDAFGDLVVAFSRVELYRFGPARRDNRFERLFFWPDRRGRGLAQVQAVIAGEDPSATGVATLRDKSVAVQGFLALDFVLFGTGADDLAAPPAGFRCAYGEAIAGAINHAAAEIAADWAAPDGFAARMLEPGPDNPVYRSHGEAVQDLLQTAAEQVEIVRDLKLAAVLGDAPEAARPRRAPFWRSHQALPAMAGNIAGIAALLEALDLDALLPEGEAALAGSLGFELGQAMAVLEEIAATDRPFETVATDPEAHGRLSYALVPLGGARDLLQTRIPAALGLVAGFNSLDGD